MKKDCILYSKEKYNLSAQLRAMMFMIISMVALVNANGNERMRQRGQHRYMISQQHTEDLFMLGFNWREIASMTGVLTLRWRRHEFGMNIGQ